MEDVYRYLFQVMWLAWALYWLYAAQSVKREIKRESIASRLLHSVPLALAALLLWANRELPGLGFRFWEPTAIAFWVGAALTASGLGFAIWARVHLGRNWSARVTIKADHELIATGPYAYARHPIYTGILLGFLGTAIARGDLRGLVAFAIAALSLWRKLRVEERLLSAQFGERYADYKREVAAIIPFVL